MTSCIDGRRVNIQVGIHSGAHGGRSTLGPDKKLPRRSSKVVEEFEEEEEDSEEEGVAACSEKWEGGSRWVGLCRWGRRRLQWLDGDGKWEVS